MEIQNAKYEKAESASVEEAWGPSQWALTPISQETAIQQNSQVLLMGTPVFIDLKGGFLLRRG